MKRLLIISLALVLSVFTSAGTKWALLVLIGNYQIQSGWNSLAGHNDKAILQEMLVRNGCHPTDTICLEDTGATHERIIAALQQIEKTARPGDIIYIHFGCHVQQLTYEDGVNYVSPGITMTSTLSSMMLPLPTTGTVTGESIS